MIEAVLFDMDGVLTDTEKFYNRSWPKAFHDFGYPDFTREDALLQRSLNHRDAAAFWKSRYGEQLDFDAIHRRSNEYVQEIIKKEGVPLKPGIRPLVNYLKEHHIKCAVATATQYDRARQRLEQTGIFDLFDAVISAHMVPQGKPHPDVYLYACEQIGAAPGSCIAIEDSPNGILSATSAGCLTIMVPDLSRPDEELSHLLFATADTLEDIIPLLKPLLDGGAA